MGKLLKRLSKLLQKKQKLKYYWAGHGDNPLKHMGVEDLEK